MGEVRGRGGGSAVPKDVPAEYPMQLFDTKISYNRKIWMIAPLEVGFDEMCDTGEPECFLVFDLLAALGLLASKPISLMLFGH